MPKFSSPTDWVDGQVLVTQKTVTDEALLKFGRELPLGNSSNVSRPFGDSSGWPVDRNGVTRHKVCVALGLVHCRPEDRERSLQDVCDAINARAKP